MHPCALSCVLPRLTQFTNTHCVPGTNQPLTKLSVLVESPGIERNYVALDFRRVHGDIACRNLALDRPEHVPVCTCECAHGLMRIWPPREAIVLPGNFLTLYSSHDNLKASTFLKESSCCMEECSGVRKMPMCKV